MSAALAPVSIEWAQAPRALASPSSELVPLLTDTTADRHAERTALTSVLMELLACKQATPQLDSERDNAIAYYQRLLKVYEQRYAPQRARYERHMRARLADLLMRAVVRADATAPVELVRLLDSVEPVRAATTALLGGASITSSSSSSSSAFSSSVMFTAKWNAVLERLSAWTPREEDVELAGTLFRLPTEETARLDGIIEQLHRDLSTLSGERTSTLRALDAALQQQIDEGNRMRDNNATAHTQLLASLQSIFQRVDSAGWHPPSQEDYAQPVAYVNERVAVFDNAFRRWKDANTLAQRKLDVLQTLTASLNELIELPRIYGGSGSVSRPFSAQHIKNAPQHLTSEFDLWVAENYTEPRRRAEGDVRSYTQAIEHAVATMVGAERAARDVATPLGVIANLDNLDSVTVLTTNVDQVRERVARASAEYQRQLDTLKRLLTTLNEVVKDVTRAIDPSAVVPALDRLSNPAQYVEAVIAGKNAERVQRANDLKELVAAVKLVIDGVDRTIWTDMIQVPAAMAAAAAAAPPPSSSPPPPLATFVSLTLQQAFADIERRTTAFAIDSNRDVAAFFTASTIASGGGGSVDYIDLLQRVMAELMARVQQRGALIAQRAQQLADSQDTLFNLTRNASDVIFSGAEAARMPSAKDMVGVRGAIQARIKQRIDARYDLYADLYYLLDSFRTAYNALQLPLPPRSTAAYTEAQGRQNEAETLLEALRRTLMMEKPVAGGAQPAVTGAQHRFGNDNSFYEGELSQVAALVDRMQPVLYAFMQRVQAIEARLDTTLDHLYAMIRNAADAVYRDASLSMPAKDQARAIHDNVLARGTRRSEERGKRFDAMAAYTLTLFTVLKMLGAADNDVVITAVEALSGRFLHVRNSRDGFEIDPNKRASFVAVFNNEPYEHALSDFADTTNGASTLLYDLLRKRQEAERQVSALDTAYTLLRQAFDAVYGESDASPYPSKADAPQLLGSVLSARIRQRTEAMGRLFDTIGSYLRATRAAMRALNPRLASVHDTLTRSDDPAVRLTRNAVGDLIIPADRNDLLPLADELVVYDRVVRLIRFFDPANATNRNAFAERADDTFATQLRAVATTVTDGRLQTVVANSVQRERQSANEMAKLDTVYSLLQTLADTIYSGRDAERLAPRERAAELPAQIDQRRALRNVQRDNEFESLIGLLQALRYILHVLGTTFGIGTQLPALDAVLAQLFVDDAHAVTGFRVRDTVKDMFRDSVQRAEVIRSVGLAVQQAQAQGYGIAKAAEQEAQALNDALQVGYSALTNMAAQLGSQPPLPSLKDVRSTPQALLGAVEDRVRSFRGNVGDTREALRTALGALWQIVEAMDMSAYTMSRSELLRVAPELESSVHTAQLGLVMAAATATATSNASDDDDDGDMGRPTHVDALPLPTVLQYLRDVANDDSFTKFTALHVATEHFARALSLHAAARMQVLSRNHQEGDTLVKQVETLSESVIQQAMALFGSDIALPRLRGFEAAAQVQTMWQHSAWRQFNSLAERLTDARNVMSSASAAVNNQPFVPGQITYNVQALMSGQASAVTTALQQLVAIRDEQTTTAKTLSAQIAHAKTAYDKAEVIVKDIERSARAFDHTKLANELELARQTHMAAVREAKNALSLTGLGLDTSALDGTDTGAMATLKSTVETAIKAQRNEAVRQKTLLAQASAEAKSIAQVSRSYDVDKALQESVATYHGLLDAYRTIADTLTVAMIANRRGRDGIPYHAMRTVRDALSSPTVHAQVQQALGVLATPPGGTALQVQVSPLANVPWQMLVRYTPDMQTLFEYAVGVVLRATVDRQVAPNNDVAAAHFARAIFLDNWPNANVVALSHLNMAPGSSGQADGQSQRQHVGQLLIKILDGVSAIPTIYGQSAVVAAGPDDVAAVNAAFRAWLTVDGTPVDAWIDALFVFIWRYTALAMLFIPAVVRDATTDEFEHVQASSSSLATCVARQLELYAREGVPRPNAFLGAQNAATEMRTALAGVAKNMYNKQALRNGQVLDTAALSTPEVARSIFRPPPPPAPGAILPGGPAAPAPFVPIGPPPSPPPPLLPDAAAAADADDDRIVVGGNNRRRRVGQEAPFNSAVSTSLEPVIGVYSGNAF